MANICPVCNYDGLNHQPYSANGDGSYEICPCCGFQLGYDDYHDKNEGYKRWLKKWINGGYKWYSRVTRPPEGWNPINQLGYKHIMECLFGEYKSSMDFTSEEVIQYLVTPLKRHDKLNIKVVYEGTDNLSLENVPDYLRKHSNLSEIIKNNDSIRQEMGEGKKISYINLDGTEGDFNIAFYGHMVAIYMLNEELMFIDDQSRKMQTTSETYGNIVYEGEFGSMSQKEILELIYQFITILEGSKKITVKEVWEKTEEYNIQNVNMR